MKLSDTRTLLGMIRIDRLTLKGSYIFSLPAFSVCVRNGNKHKN